MQLYISADFADMNKSQLAKIPFQFSSSGYSKSSQYSNPRTTKSKHE